MKRYLLINLLLATLTSLVYSLEPGSFVTSGPSSSKKIALTFDDGPGPHTKEFFDMLDKYQVKGTFFMLGELVGYRKDVVKEMTNRGHELASHTMKHINYLQRFKQLEKELSNKEKALDIVRSELMQDMEKSRKVIESASGVKINLCRMPHGIDRPWVNEAAKKNGFVMVNWTYGSDWEKRAEDAQKKDYVNSIKPGAILLFHDGGNKREKTLALTEAVIKAAKEKGYEIVTAGELLGVK